MMLRRWLSGLTRVGRRMEFTTESSRGERPRDCRREGTCPASWRASVDYYTFRTF